MPLTIEQAKSLKESLGVVIPDDFFRQKELEAAFQNRSADILARFPDFKAYSPDRAAPLFDSAGQKAQKQRDFTGALAVLGQLETLLAQLKEEYENYQSLEQQVTAPVENQE